MKSSLPFRKKPRRALTLVETLIVIAVIGVITAIAIPSIMRISDQAEKNQAKRNAQLIAATVSEAVGGGNTTILTAGDLDTAVSMVLAGLPVPNGVNGNEARLSLSAEDAEKAKPYLVYENRILLYNP